MPKRINKPRRKVPHLTTAERDFLNRITTSGNFTLEQVMYRHEVPMRPETGTKKPPLFPETVTPTADLVDQILAKVVRKSKPVLSPTRLEGNKELRRGVLRK